MIRGAVVLLAALYCFVWLRIPDVAGVALPIQRLIAWAILGGLLAQLLLRDRLVAGPLARRFLGIAGFFLVFLGFTLVEQLAFGREFRVLYFAMDFSKYLAIFAVAYGVYYALTARLVRPELLATGIRWSGAASAAVVFLLLGLYWAGFRSENETLANSWNGALGVWPTGGILPRLAGTTAEPQQLSVALLTPLLLMLSRARLRRDWPLAIPLLLAIALSQSKFAVISLAVVAGYVFLVYPERRRILLALGVLALPAAGLALIRLPTYAATLAQGWEAGAFVERLQNLILLMGIIREHALLGIGAGQYGVYRGVTLFGDPMFNPGYTPNMDFLKVFAETGIVGFLIVTGMIGSLLLAFARAARGLGAPERDRYLAFLLGAVAITLNMMIGYELLHVFFWINVGVLMYAAERVRRIAPAPRRAPLPQPAPA